VRATDPQTSPDVDAAPAPIVGAVSLQDLPPTPDLPAQFAPVADRLTAYAELLATAGVERGLIGPREVPRLWDRHILNSAVLGELVPEGVLVVDVGSGAGLPGLPLAICRPDLHVVLLEPLLRRATFLFEAVEALGLGATVTVDRGRAEERATKYAADIVTARALAPLDRLAGWCLPLVKSGGALLALKGSQAADEIATSRATITSLGGSVPEILTCGAGVVDPLTTVVRIVRTGTAARGSRRPR
jgi:16S rRNA (guanine527-N7)-methyltransferase